MKMRLVNHTVFADYHDLRVDGTVIDRIAGFTAETWQPDRKTEERGQNTRQGKTAEELVERFLKAYFHGEISVKPYDEIRSDAFRKHAPFDLLIWKSGTAEIAPIEEAVRRDIAASPDASVRLSGETRRRCREANVKIAEIKSTQIREQLKREANFTGDYTDLAAVSRLTEVIRRTDDIFCYPHYRRSEARETYSMEDYCLDVKAAEPSLAPYRGEELRKRVIALEAEKQCVDVFIRVYLDQEAGKGFIMGWMRRGDLLDGEVCLKRMYRKNKSERALYFAKKLSGASAPETISEVFAEDE